MLLPSLSHIETSDDQCPVPVSSWQESMRMIPDTHMLSATLNPFDLLLAGRVCLTQTDLDLGRSTPFWLVGDCPRTRCTSKSMPT